MKTKQILDFDFELNIAEETLGVRGIEIPNDQMQFFRTYPNHLSISAIKCDSYVYEETGKELTLVRFILNSNPHPKCDFEYICVYVNLNLWPNAEIVDMCPLEIKGDMLVEYNVVKGAGSKLAIEVVGVPDLSFERSSSLKSNIYFLKLRGAGIGDNIADWIFEKEPHSNSRLHFSNELTLLVLHDITDDFADPVFSIEAKLRLHNWLGEIPIYGSKRVLLQK